MANPARRTRQARTLRGRYPRQLVVMTDERQDDAVREHAEAMNHSINQVVRDAIDAGLPILRRRAEEDGTLTPAVA